MAAKTKVVTYKKESVMNFYMGGMQRQGWEVANVQRSGQGYSFVKTAGLGLIFLPLALLGKKKDVFVVTYRKE